MATQTTRFETQLPNVDYNDTQTISAVNNFLLSMNTLLPGKCYAYESHKTDFSVEYVTFYGYLTTAQQSTALGYLTTLNANVLSQYSPVVCYAANGTLQP